MEQYFLQFLSIYFWVFIFFNIIWGIYIQGKEFKLIKENSIKYGRKNFNGLNAIIGYSLFILSIITTWIK